MTHKGPVYNNTSIEMGNVSLRHRTFPRSQLLPGESRTQAAKSWGRKQSMAVQDHGLRSPKVSERLPQEGRQELCWGTPNVTSKRSLMRLHAHHRMGKRYRCPSTLHFCPVTRSHPWQHTRISLCLICLHIK